MEYLKEIRWKQRFEDFNKSYTLLDRYSKKKIYLNLNKLG